MPRATFKQPVTASRAIVTTNHPEASAAGLEILAMGGNAVDAAVASLFALSVVEPMMVSPHGAGFFVLRNGKTGRVATIDNYASAPIAARADMYRPIAGSLENDVEDGENDWGYRSVAVPGNLAGWSHAAKNYGSLPLEVLVEPAVRRARRGFTVSPYLAQCIDQEQEILSRFPASKAVFLPDGAVPLPGSRITRLDFAGTLERMGRNGASELIDGETARSVAEDMARNNGLVTIRDGLDYQIHERAPIRGSYRGYELIAMGPVSSGGLHILQMLRILEGFDVRSSGFGSIESVHLLAEVMKIAFADRFKHVADPAEVNVPVEWLTSTGYANQRRDQIMANAGTAGDYGAGSGPIGSPNTTHLNVIDSDGTMVSATQTLNWLFGSRVTTPGTGMLLNDCMKLMDPVPGRTNSIKPGKRILSSMSPTLILKDGKPWLAIGTPGGARIFPSVLQAIVNLIDHQMTPQEAVEAPRCWTMGPVLELEDTYDDIADLVVGLERRGHRIEIVSKIAGGMSAIQVDQVSGLLTGASCWRADGAPVGLSGGDARPVDVTLTR